jgi:hypothetical protein
MLFISLVFLADHDSQPAYYFSGEYLFTSKKNRARDISRYGFECDCKACKYNYPMLAQMKSMDTALADTTSLYLEMIDKLQFSTTGLKESLAVRLVEKCCALLLDAQATSETNIDLREDVSFLRLTFHRLVDFLANSCEQIE